jgi:hypothetical protein
MNYNSGFLMDKDVFIKQLNIEDALVDAALYPASTSFIDVADYDRFAFLVGAGALDSATTLQVQQDTSATATAGLKDVTGATLTISATGDDKWYLIEVDTSMLDSNNGFRYVTLEVTGPATVNDFGAIFFLGFGAGERPVTQGADKGAAVFIGG